MKTYLLILGLSTALSTGATGPGNQRKACEQLVLSGHTQAMLLKDTALQAKVKSLLARAENSAWRENEIPASPRPDRRLT